MKLIKPSFKILNMGGGGLDLQLIELAERVCYKSENGITKDSTSKFVKMIKDRGHYSVLEQSSLTIKFICDRGISHELVRHGIASPSQESTRYCNYKGGVTFIIPPWVDIEEGEYVYKCIEGVYFFNDITLLDTWINCMAHAEENYVNLLRDNGWSPQQARSVLPNSLKTEIIVTANFREWMHIFKLRCAKAAHPQMRELMIPLRDEMIKKLPEIFKEGGEE